MDLVEFAELAANNGKIVIVSSLGGTFLRGPFAHILELMPLCEKIKKLSAICKICKQTASFTYRTADENDTSLIGGAEKYMPVCRECHTFYSNQKSNNVYMGDPTVINADFEIKSLNESKVLKENSMTNVTCSGSSNSTSSVSPEAKNIDSSKKIDHFG
jgi:ribosomal protein L31